MKALEISTAISFKNILFLTDFTQASNAARACALAFARKYDACLYPAHVIEPVIPGEMDVPITANLSKNFEDEKRRKLGELFQDTGVTYTELVAQGVIETIVPAWTVEHGIDLIVMGTHGRRGVDRLFLGSTAEAIFRNATCPVLTVGPGVNASDSFNTQKVLFATSLTKKSEPALTYALSFAEESGAELTILHVVPSESELTSTPFAGKEVAKEKLEKLAAEEIDFAHRPKLFVAEGDPAKRILEYAETEQSELIVLGLAPEAKPSTHFRSGIAYKVIRAASCPVLTIR